MTEMLPDSIPDPSLDNPLPEDREPDPADDTQPDHSNGVMIALKVPDPDLYAVPDGTEPDDLHVTLVYLGKANELSPEQKQAVVQSAQEAAARFGRPPQALFPYDYGTFPSDAPEGSPFVLHPLGDDLDELYGHVCNALKENGLGDKIAADHPFNPHVTLKYLDDGEQVPHQDYTPPDMNEVSFPTMRVSVGPDEHPISLTPTAERPIRPQQILFSIEERLHNLVQDHNLTASRGSRASLPMLKAVYSREFQDARSTPSQSLTASAIRRCDSFLTALAVRNATHPDADLFPPASPPSPFERTLQASISTGSDRIKIRLLDAAISADPAERSFNLSRALHAAASSRNPRVTFSLTEPLRTLLADGQSSAARSMRAKLQLRDRHGRWIDEGKGIRFKVHAPGAPGSGTWYHGTVEGQDVPNGLLSVRLEDGRLVQVPANKVEQPAAILGLQGEHLNRTPDANLDPHAPTVANLHEISAPAHAQEPVGAGQIRSLLDRVQTRIHDTFRDARPQEKDPVARMMRAVGQATRDLQNPNTPALEQASAWIDQFLRDNPSLSVAHRNDLLYAQDTFRNMTPVLNNYHHDPRNFTPAHPAARAEHQRPRPFRQFRNGRAEDNPGVQPAIAEIPAAGERVTVPSIQAPHYMNGARPATPDELHRYLHDDYGLNVNFNPGPNGRDDPNHLSISGDKAHVDAALRDVWGLHRDDAGNLTPLPDPASSSSDHADAGPLQNAEAAIQLVENAHPGLANMAESLQHALDEAGSNPTPQQWQELADQFDGARQVLDLMANQASPEDRPRFEAARNALNDAATNAWNGARPEPAGANHPSEAPANAPNEHAQRVGQVLDQALQLLGDAEDQGLRNTQHIRDMVGDVHDDINSGAYNGPSGPEQLAGEIHAITQMLHDDVHGRPDHGTQSGVNQAADRAVQAFGAAEDAARAAMNAGDGNGNGSPSAPSAPHVTPAPDPQAQDQFGNIVPAGFDFNQEITNQGAKVQLYDHVGSDGRQYQVAVRPQRFGGQPQYVVRQSITYNGRQSWAVLGSHDNWHDVGERFTQIEHDNEAHRQSEANRARLEQHAQDEGIRIQQSHQRRVAENVDDAGNPLPTGWTRHLDEANGTYYQDGAGNMVMSTGAPDHALALYAKDPIVGGRERVGIFDNWGQVHTALTAHQRDRQAAIRSNILVAADHNNLNLSEADKQAILDAPNQRAVRDILEANPEYQAIRRRGADAQQADHMQQRERDAYRLDNAFQGLVRKVGDMPAAPGTGEGTPSPNANGPVDEAHRRLPEGWVALPADDNRIGQMYMGPGGATAYVDTNRPGNPITVGYENQGGEARQISGLPDWNAVTEALIQVDRGIDPSNSSPLPDGPLSSDNANADAAHGGITAMLTGLGVHENEVARALAEPTGDQQRFAINQIPEVRQIRREAEIGNPDQVDRAARLDQYLGQLNGAPTPAPQVDPRGTPPHPGVGHSDVAEHNARINRDRETGFRDSLYHNLVQVGVPPQEAGQIYNMRSADDVRNFVGGLAEVRDVMAAVAEQNPSSVNPLDQRNANLLNRNLNIVQDLPGSSPDIANLPVGQNSQAFIDAADGLDTWLRDRLQLGDEQRNHILDDPNTAIDLIEGNSLVQNLRANAADGNERAIRDVAQLDGLEHQLRDALAGGSQGGPRSPGAPEGSPGNPNDVVDSGAPPQAPAAPAPAPRVGAPPGYENRYHPDGVIQDRLGRQIARGARVVSRRDGQNVIGTVVAVQQMPPYARIQWPDGRRQVRAGNRLTVVQAEQAPGFNAPARPGVGPGAMEGRPVSELPDPPAAPAAPGRIAPAGNALEQATAIAEMHRQGANRGFPLLTNVGNAKDNINNAIQRIAEGDRAGAANQVSAAVNQYSVAMGTPAFRAANADYQADVTRRMELAQALHQSLMDPNFALQAPNANDAINGLAQIRQAIPTRAPRGQAQDAVHRAYRYGGFALDDALPLLRNGNLAEAERSLTRAISKFRIGNRPDLADQVQQHLNDLRAAGLRPSNAPNPEGAPQFGDNPEPRDFIANRFAGERAPVAAPPNTPGVVDPRDGQEGMNHPQAANPAAVQADYADWGPRAAEIAQAARVRPSLTAITQAGGNEQSQLIKEAFGGLDGITFGKNGYKLQLSGSASRDHLSVSFTIYDANGNRVGNGSRSMSGTGGQWTAYNAGMSLNSDARSTGFANALNRYFENWYIANGFHSVTVSAAGGGGYTGGFAWAMNGFGWKDPFNSDAPNALAKVERSTRAGSSEAAVVAQLKARMEQARRTRNESLMPTPMEMALVGWAPGKTTWVGKTAMKGHSWGGRKVLQPTSVNWQQRQNYEIAKQAEERVANKENAFNVNRGFAAALGDMSPAGLREAGITPVEAEQIAKIMRSTNPSAAQLPFTTKRKLSNWANGQAAAGNYNSDIQNVATVLQQELMADYPKEDSLGIGQALQGFTYAQMRAGNVPGFTVRRLGAGESGINDTFLVTHNDSGQVFFVKKDMGIYNAANPRIKTTGSEAERDVNALMRQMNWPGIDLTESHSIDGGVNPANPDSMQVQHRVGDNLDLVSRPKAAGDIGTAAAHEAFNNLAQHDQLLRMLVMDGLIGNPDRHGKNFMLGQGTDGKWWLFPIDHGLARTPVDGAERNDPFEAFKLSIMRGSQLHGSALAAYAQQMGEVNLRNLLRGILADYRTGVSQPAIFKSSDFSGKMGQNIDLLERRLDDMVNHLLGLGRGRRR